MEWIPFTDDRGEQWAVSQLGLWMLCRQYLHAEMISERSQLKVEKQYYGYVFPLPDIHTVEVNFQGFAQEKDKRAPLLYDDMSRRSLGNAATTFTNLVDMKRQTDKWTADFKAKQRGASQATMSNIERSVAKAELGKEVATVVRDVSATVVVTGATFMSGGTALAFLGGGSALKGAYKYQDTGNVGAAVLEGGGTFVLGAISMAPQLGAMSGAASLKAFTGGGQTVVKSAVQLSRTDERVLMVVGVALDGTFEFSKGLVAGDSVEKALMSAGTQMVSSSALSFAGMGLDRIAMPVWTRLTINSSLDYARDKGKDYLVSRAFTPPAITPGLAHLSDVPPGQKMPPSDQDYIRQNVLRRM